MAFLFPTLLVVLFLATVLCLLAESMWSNAIRFINVVFAALLATNFWEPVARLLENSVSKGGSYWWDFVALWVLFAVLITILQTVTKPGFESKVVSRRSITRSAECLRVHDCGGPGLVRQLHLHTAPRGKSSARRFHTGRSRVPRARRQWARFMTFASRGSMSKFGGPVEFDPKAKFDMYRSRRAALEAQLADGKGFGAESPPAR